MSVSAYFRTRVRARANHHSRDVRFQSRDSLPFYQPCQFSQRSDFATIKFCVVLMFLPSVFLRKLFYSLLQYLCFTYAYSYVFL